MASRSVSVTEVLDSVPFTSYQVLVGILCFCCTLLDGFDLTVIGVAVPKMAEYLHLKPQAFGLAISAGQFGPLFGAALLGMLADRVGRKRMLIFCALLFGVFTVLQATITSVGELALFRFIGGLGMGGAVPSAISFGAEYSPSRSRATLSTALYAGVPTGATISGLSAVWLLPHVGWQSLFYLGGGIPIIIAILMMFLLPESINFLVRRPDCQEKVRRIIGRIAPTYAKDKDIEFCSTEVKRKGVPVKHLFLEKRAAVTILMWVCFFLGYYLIYLMQAWAPTLLKKSGATVQQYALAFAFINLGSAITTVCIGWLMDKAKNPTRILQGGFIIGFFTLVAFGYFASSPFYIIAGISILNGIFINGTVSGLVALVTISYPSDVTGTAVGWAYALGRLGSTVSPLMGAVFLGLNWTVFQICGTNAFLALVIVVIIAILSTQAARMRKEVSTVG
jgi:AAHS family 4-hydroxybenzoate transporter-like MFS transporter